MLQSWVGPVSDEVCGLGLALVGGSPNLRRSMAHARQPPPNLTPVSKSYHPLSGVKVALPYGDGQTFPFSFLFILVPIRKPVLYVASLGF